VRRRFRCPSRPRQNIAATERTEKVQKALIVFHKGVGPALTDNLNRKAKQEPTPVMKKSKKPCV